MIEKKTEIDFSLGTILIFSKKYRFVRQSIFDKKSKVIGLGKSSKFFENFFSLKQVYMLQNDRKKQKLNLVWEQE